VLLIERTNRLDLHFFCRGKGNNSEFIELSKTMSPTDFRNYVMTDINDLLLSCVPEHADDTPEEWTTFVLSEERCEK